MGEYWYVGAIELGIITIEDVPDGWRKRVIEILDKRQISEYGNFANEAMNDITHGKCYAQTYRDVRSVNAQER